MTPDELLTTTRTVRKRLDLDRPVDLEVVQDCLRIALQAPNGGNRQRWRWIVVADAEQRAALAALYLKAARTYFATSNAETKVRESAEYLAENLHRVPVFVIPCLELPELPAGNQAGIWASILPATWSYMLAARTRGLGTAWTTLHLNYEREAAEILGLPETVRQAALIPTAYTLGTDFKPARREALEDVLHLDRW
ncbi:oxidoreductase [Lentzea sp. NBRC 105346]|uniref:nitroreductase family protein n=1 Tax=Lentzea sp. NBRC 105346 TaxID=3032205 RepID=UPI0024A5EE5C|nr:nitroreductase family protein [Lentzea sp. NBRC 105346]GLZ29815.1 oxidoreductase [Lentzea sp. NBRC 105346]